MSDDTDKHARFETMVLPHLDAAYNLARWLTGNDHDAQDVVQEAVLRAFKFFAGWRGENGRSWLLTIVRRTGYSWIKKNRSSVEKVPFDEEIHQHDDSSGGAAAAGEATAFDHELLRRTIEKLPPEFREIIVLREMEQLSYHEIGSVLNLPLGTVMSRLSRARARVHDLWKNGKREIGAAL